MMGERIRCAGPESTHHVAQPTATERWAPLSQIRVKVGGRGWRGHFGGFAPIGDGDMSRRAGW